MIHKSETGKRILKNAAYLAVGSIVGKATMFIVFILIARYFGPGDFGAYNTAFNHVFLLGMLSKLGFDMAVIREGAKNLEEVPLIQNKIFSLRFWVSIFVFLATITTAYIIEYEVVTMKLILIMSPLVFVGGAINSGIIEHFTSYFKIIEKMQYAAYVLLFRTILFAVAVLSLLFFDVLSLYTLSIMVVITSIAALWFQIIQAKKFYRQEYSLRINYKYISSLIKPILLFGIVSILYEVSLRLNIIMINKLSTNVETGLYSAAWNLVSIGTLFIASFSESIFPNSARNIFNYSYLIRMFKGLLIGAIIFSFFCLAIILLSDSLVLIIYGEMYLQASQILSIIIWFLPLRLFSLWGHQIMESADYLTLRILVFIIPTVINIFLNYLLIPNYGALGSAYSALASNFILLILAIVAALYIIRSDVRFNKKLSN